MNLVVPVWDMAARDADVVPTSFDELPAIKSRWVVMQHAKKGSSVHDLPSVPDFDLLDPAWMELNPAPDVVGKTKLIEKQIHAANFSGQGLVDLDEQARDGELETLVNHDADPPPPPPAPMFRDDEMESWLLYPLDEPLDPGLKQEAWQEAAAAVAAAAGAEQIGTQTEGAEKNCSTQSGLKAPTDSAQHGQKNGGIPVGDGAKQGLGRQDALRHLTGAIGPASTSVKRSGVGLSGGIPSSAERPGSADGGAVKSSAGNVSMEASKGMMEKALKFQQQQQLQLQRLQQQLIQQQKKQNEQAQQHHQQQVAAEQQQTAALLKEELRQQEQELLAHLLLEQRFQQEKKQQQQVQQQQQQQQQNQQVEQAGVTRQGSGFTCQQSGQSMAPPSAPLNFSHFSRPAHMYSRANLKNMGAALTGNGSAQQKSQRQQSPQHQPQQQQQQQQHRQLMPPQQQQQQQQQQQRDQHQHRQQPEMPSASAGRGIMSMGAKLPAALLAKYQSLSSGSSVAESIQRPKQATAAPCADARTTVSGAQSGGSPVAVSHDSVARGSPGVAALSFGNGCSKPASVQHLVSGATYAPLGAKIGHALDRQDVGEMSGSEPAHMSTVTSSLLARRAQQAKAEREATVSSTHGMPLRRAVMETSAARMVASGPGASAAIPEVSARSVGTGSGFKRTRDVETTDYTQSEDVPEESGDTRKTGKKLGGGAKEENSAAKRARAAEVHNMSERRRRDRINERMKMLQELIPNSNKTDKASMLDEAIEYLKMLQLQLQVMSMRSGMSIPPNLAPTGASSNLTALAVSIAQQQQQQQPHQQQPQASQMSASLAQLGMGGSQTGGSGSMGGSSSASGIMGMMASTGGQALMGMTMGGGAGMGMAMGMGGAMGGMGAIANLFDQDISSLPAQQRLFLEMARADMEQGMNGAAGVSGASLQQQALEEQLQQQQLMGLAGKFASPFLQQSGGGTSSSLGAGNTAALMSQLQAGNGPVGAMMAMRGLGLSASGGQRRGSNSGMMGSTELSSGESLGQSRLGAAAAAAVAMEGHRQLNPSAVDPLDAYLARHQRMQQQHQQMKPQPSLDQTSVDLEMYQAILKRQHQAM